ncbi:MAG: Triosephosphate isomerase [uncultured Sphingomonadaceae bacterium]|uniref:Triosephosphate isomerase n=1 Tax=uncultured Sphingomonadaceae bacterium TaxID=169976 RepID=A0A6J4SBE5_9SPHN|nr:MAG: Triosephosphate isomerase [uncultured Sphingomonadaceae bacterium]
MIRRKLVAGNWKMNGSVAALAELDRVAEAARASDADVAVCPPATLLALAHQRAPELPLGIQDVHCNPHGAHTGCVSARMAREAGATYAIVGHSERRTDQRESDEDVRGKAAAAITEGLTAIVCVGESEAEREAGRALDVVADQVRGSLPPAAEPERLVVAYEPIWAIGTGRTATPDDVAEMHARIRAELRGVLGEAGEGVRILYGGSVNPGNAAELFAVPDVDGALVGGASLTADKFVPIIEAAA